MIAVEDLLAPVPWPSLPHLLAQRALEHPDRELLRCPDRSLRFGAVAELTARIASRLHELGVREGDRVGIMLPNVSGWPVGWLAVLHAGAVAVPINHAYASADLRHVIEDSGLRLVITEPARLELVTAAATELNGHVDVVLHDELERTAADLDAAPLPGGGPDRLANLQYTSGTTGFPKACMLTHRYWQRVAQAAAAYGSLTCDDIALTAQPFSYIDPLWNVAACLLVGIPLVVLPRFSASGMWASVREHGATFFYVLGTMPLLLFKQPPHPADRDNQVRLVMCSGIPAHLHAQLEQRWGAPWRETYGLTESGANLVVPIVDDTCVGTGTLGGPVAGQQVRVVDTDLNEVPAGAVGEIVIRGDNLMLGYWNRPEATAEAFRGDWFHTGDLGYVGPDGGFRLAGRLKDMVRRGGENIAAAEVESVLSDHPAVLSAAVVAQPDATFGEEVKAYVRVADDADLRDEQLILSILDLAAGRLARFKVPRYVELVTTFPMTPSERVAKKELVAVPGATYDRTTEGWT
ncbi:MAG TPA: AMP-binding protein [Mycobacteriales bacterium]|nr:AMP-binding protein [Mycobacteriales bacterium]